jgi:hypothetical protein
MDNLVHACARLIVGSLECIKKIIRQNGFCAASRWYAMLNVAINRANYV